MTLFKSGMLAKLVGPTAEAVPCRYLHSAAGCAAELQPDSDTWWTAGQLQHKTPTQQLHSLQRSTPQVSLRLVFVLSLLIKFSSVFLWDFSSFLYFLHVKFNQSRLNDMTDKLQWPLIIHCLHLIHSVPNILQFKFNLCLFYSSLFPCAAVSN